MYCIAGSFGDAMTFAPADLRHELAHASASFAACGSDSDVRRLNDDWRLGFAAPQHASAPFWRIASASASSVDYQVYVACDLWSVVGMRE